MTTREVPVADSAPFIFDPGPYRERVEEWVRSGEFESVDDVLRAGLHALQEVETPLDNEYLARLAEEALDDPSPSIPAEEVFRKIRARYGRPEVNAQW